MRTLLEFPHSHFCEKARWALDFKGLDYERRSLFPGYHARVVMKIARRSTVPVFIDGDCVVQGSGDIMSYLDERYPARPLNVPGQEEAVLAFEAEADQTLGKPLRRMLYHRLLREGADVRYYFMHRSPGWQKALMWAVYPALVWRIRSQYRIDEAGFSEAALTLNGALDRLDARLAGGGFLFGDRFSRADITVASLLCFLCMPPEHPVTWRPVKDPATAALIAGYAERPTTRWVKRVYQEQRRFERATNF